MDTQSGGLIADMLDWIHHPRFTKSDPVDFLLWAVLLMMLGLAWSKVIRQTLDSTITTINKVAE